MFVKTDNRSSRYKPMFLELFFFLFNNDKVNIPASSQISVRDSSVPVSLLQC